MTLWYKDFTATSLSGKKNDDSIQTNIITKEFEIPKHFRVNFFVVAIKIIFFHYFGLLHDLLGRQDLTNNLFERRLKRSAMFLSIFRKGNSPSCFYFSNSLGNFEMTLETFGYQWFQFLSCELNPMSDISFSSFYWQFKIISTETVVRRSSSELVFLKN